MTTAIAKPSSLSRTISVTVEVDLDVIEYGKGLHLVASGHG